MRSVFDEPHWERWGRSDRLGSPMDKCKCWSVKSIKIKSRTAPALVALGWCRRCSYWCIWALIGVTIYYMILIEHEMRLNQIIGVRADRKDYSRCTLQASISVTLLLMISTTRIHAFTLYAN